MLYEGARYRLLILIQLFFTSYLPTLLDMYFKAYQLYTIHLTGATINLARQAKPNVAVEVVVGSYEPLKVEVRTTSADSGGGKKVITITEQDIYPGEPTFLVITFSFT